MFDGGTESPFCVPSRRRLPHIRQSYFGRCCSEFEPDWGRAYLFGLADDVQAVVERQTAGIAPITAIVELPPGKKASRERNRKACNCSRPKCRSSAATTIRALCRDWANVAALALSVSRGSKRTDCFRWLRILTRGEFLQQPSCDGDGHLTKSGKSHCPGGPPTGSFEPNEPKRVPAGSVAGFVRHFTSSSDILDCR
jgi:hypothetical protein